MSTPFSNTNPMLSGPWEPWSMEGEIGDCAVEGEIPRDLATPPHRKGRAICWRWRGAASKIAATC